MKHIEYIGEHILDDNILSVFELMQDILLYSDPEYRFKLSYKKGEDVIGHVFPSKPEYKQEIIDNLMHFNRKMGLKVRYSKSLKISKTVSFTIDINSLPLSQTN